MSAFDERARRRERTQWRGLPAVVVALIAVHALAVATADVEKMIDEGRYAEAVPLAEQLVRETEKESGPNAVETGVALRVLAAAYERAGRLSDALPIAERAVAALEPESASPGERDRALIVLAKVESGLGNYAAAEKAAERAANEAESNRNHPLKARALVVLSEAYRGAGDHKRALAEAKRAFALDDAERASDDPVIAESLDQVGLAYAGLGDANAAQPLYQRALAIREKALGDHPLTAESLTHLAALLWTRRDYDGALGMFRRALDIERRTLGDAHPSTAATLSKLAEAERTRPQ